AFYVTVGYASRIGAACGVEPNGLSFLWQQISVPAGTTTLTCKFKGTTFDSITYDQEQIVLTDALDNPLATLLNVCETDAVFQNLSFDLTAYAGQTIKLWFQSNQDGAGDVTFYVLTDVSVKKGVTELITNGSFASSLTG